MGIPRALASSAMILVLSCMLALSCGVDGGASSSLPCTFSSQFTVDSLLNNASALQHFESLLLWWEGQYHAGGIGFHSVSGMTLDGALLDESTGLIKQHWPWSAASKEAIHFGLLALALDGSLCAQRFISASRLPLDAPPSTVKEEALSIAVTLLDHKITSLERWNRTFPGFGGFLPWFEQSEGGEIAPLRGWTNKVPGLDNGEMVWSLLCACDALDALGGHDRLAARCHAYHEYLVSTSLSVWYGGNGIVRAVSLVKNATAPPREDNFATISGSYLDDPYEGELMTFWLDLFAPWERKSERNRMWQFKQRANKLQRVEFPTPAGNITVQRGWWFSSHEQWKYLELPYADVEINARVFRNGERARTWNSYLHQIPGLYASVTNVSTGARRNGGYLSAAGIGEIAFQTINTTAVVTPYACFPSILAQKSVALAWYLTMLKGDKMQSVYGSVASIDINGEFVAPALTWDSKILTVFSLCGGITPLSRRVLKAQGKYQRFTQVVHKEWTRVFPSLRGETLDYQIPNAALPRHGKRYSTCGADPTGHHRKAGGARD